MPAITSHPSIETPSELPPKKSSEINYEHIAGIKSADQIFIKS